MSEVKILKGVPIPPKPGKYTKYPWTEMEVGDCFVYGKSFYSAVAQAKHHTADGKEFVARKVDGIPHVWRTK